MEAWKHGTAIWDPTCHGQGADLQWRGNSHGVMQLKEALNIHGMGDYPVIATLSGTWMGKQRTNNGFLPQPRTVFLMSDAADISRSKRVERP